MFGLFKLIVECFKNVDDPNHPEGRRELIRRGMLARLADDRAEGSLAAGTHEELRKQVLDTLRLARAIRDYAHLDAQKPDVVEDFAYLATYDILEYWKK